MTPIWVYNAATTPNFAAKLLIFLGICVKKIHFFLFWGYFLFSMLGILIFVVSLCAHNWGFREKGICIKYF